MNQRIKDKILALVPFVSLLIIWYIFYYFNLTPKWLIPSPFETALTFWELAVNGTIINLILASAANAVPAFIVALICAVVLGTLIGINTTVRKIFFPFLSAIYLIPSLAWLPLIILFLGFTREAIWLVIFISSFRRIIYNVIGGVRNVNLNWVLAAKNLGLNKLEIILKVILPGALPQIITGIKMGFGSSWRSLIGAEMLVMTLGGLGKFIWTAQWFFNFDKVIIGIVILAIIGLFMEEIVFKRFEKITLIRWGLVREDI